MTQPQKLLRFDEVAKILDVPVEGLRKVADQHGVTLIIGRAARLHPDDIGSLLEKCRVGQKARAFTGENPAVAENRYGKSGTAQQGSRPAQIAAKKLKKPSQHTLSENTAQPVPLRPTK